MATLLARGQITIAAIRDGRDGAQGPQGAKGDKGEQGDRGPQGATGAAGKDAVSASFSPAALTFSAKTKGSGNYLADVSSGNTSTITMLEGSSEVTGSYVISSAVSCSATVAADGTVRVNRVAYDTIDGRAISRTSASVTVKCVYGGKTCYVNLPISVSVSAVWGGLVTSQNGLESKYNEVSSKYNALPLKTTEALTQYTSTIKQTAREISLKVSQTAVGRKNLLVGSDFRKQSDRWQGNDSYRPYISVLNQYGGCNSVVMENGANTGHGLDFLNVPVKKGKSTASIMAKFDGKPEYGSFAIYVVRKDANKKGLDNNSWIPLNVDDVVVGQWAPYSTSFDVDDKCKVIDLCFVCTSNHTAWFAQPMLVDGDEYVGWSLSDEDADYIGGNLLDNSDTLVQGGNLTVRDGSYSALHPRDNSDDEINRQSYKGFPTLNTDIRYATDVNLIDMLEWELGADVVKQGQDYMFSFMAKGKKGGKFTAYFYKSDTTEKVFVEVLDRVVSPNQHTAAYSNAQVECKEDYVWQRYWVHWRVVGSNVPARVLIRCNKGTDMYVSQPKLEYGATVTEYRATKTDFVEDKSVAGKLLDAGIDIDSKEITMTADKTKFRTTKGTKVAVFDESGINAQLVRAQRLQTRGTNGSEVQIENGMMQVFGAAGVANIRFGLDENGYATLGYYDNDGNLLYDLGPKGIVSLNLTKPSLTRAMYIDLAAAGLTTPYYSKKDGYNWISDANNKKVFGGFAVADRYVRNNLGVNKGVELYQYRAPCINGEIAADSTYNLTKAQAKKANGCYFTSNQIQVVGDKFLNIAKGAYLPWDTKTVDNTKYRLPGGTKVPKLLVRMLITQTVLNSVPFTNFETVYGGGVYVYPGNGMDFSAQ